MNRKLSYLLFFILITFIYGCSPVFMVIVNTDLGNPTSGMGDTLTPNRIDPFPGGDRSALALKDTSTHQNKLKSIKIQNPSTDSPGHFPTCIGMGICTVSALNSGPGIPVTFTFDPTKKNEITLTFDMTGYNSADLLAFPADGNPHTYTFGSQFNFSANASDPISGPLSQLNLGGRYIPSIVPIGVNPGTIKRDANNPNSVTIKMPLMPQMQ